MRMGYEGRGLLNALGHNDTQSLREQSRMVLAKYSRALTRWLSRSTPETPWDSKVSGFLGQPTRDRRSYLRELTAAIGSEKVAISSLKQLVEGKWGGSSSKARPLACLNCDGSSEGPSGPGCLCSWAMVIDAGLLSAGTSGEPGAEYRRFVEEHILACANAINSWLEGNSPQPVTVLRDARYVGGGNGSMIAQGVHSGLGARDDAKERLAVCLLKTIKDNQRWHDRVELIDSFPGTNSWLAGRL